MKKQLFIVLGIILLNQFCSAMQLDTYTLTGRIIDYKGNYVENAVVICYKDYADRDKQGYVKYIKTQTSSDGKFSFEINRENISPLIVAYKPGLALGWASVHYQTDFYPTVILGEPTFVKGIVVDEEAHPVAGVDVRIILENRLFANANIKSDYLDPENWYSKKTNAEGQFKFENVPKGTYTQFEIRASGNATICVERDNLSYTEYFSAGRDDIRIVLPTESRIKGQVVDESTSRGVADILVQVLPCSSINYYLSEQSIKTNQDGRFEFTALESNELLLRIIDDKKGYGNVTITTGKGKNTDNVKIIYKKGLPFEVAVYDSTNENPVENADVKVTNLNESDFIVFEQKVTSDVNGIAQLYVPSGESNLEVTIPGYGTTMFDRSDLKINPLHTNRKDIYLSRTANFISGDVVDEKGNLVSGAVVIKDWFGPRVITGANGRFDTRKSAVYTCARQGTLAWRCKSSTGPAAGTVSWTARAVIVR